MERKNKIKILATERCEKIDTLHKILTSKLTGNIYLGSPRWKWEDDIRTDLKEMSITTRIGLIRFIGEPLSMRLEPLGSISHVVTYKLGTRVQVHV